MLLPEYLVIEVNIKNVSDMEATLEQGLREETYGAGWEIEQIVPKLQNGCLPTGDYYFIWKR